ncbi:MAG: 30S ribosomal protein S3 [Candidatus Pacebacteria bacterium]|nr:30S ribosomal protein S3 [Candidatus Paceibacterota bacterium]
MTHVVHPYAHRLGGIRDWKSKWTASKSDYKDFLKADFFIREFLEKELKHCYISSISFERNTDKKYSIIINTSRPGMIIGRGGDGIEKLTKKIKSILKKKNLIIPLDLKVVINDVHSPESDAGIVMAQIIEGLEKRMPFRRILKMTAEKVMANRDVQGIKISVSGRLGGADMARREHIKKGRIPLSTFRADVDYRDGRANLPYGVIGIKVWIYGGEVFDKK